VPVFASPQVARCCVVGLSFSFYRQQFGLNLFAYILCNWATWMEAAAGRRIDRVRDLPARHGLIAPKVRIGYGHSRKQRLGVGVLWLAVDLLQCPDFGYATKVQDGDTVADVLGGCQIVGDE
jgi:hypothetical protein